MDKELKEFQNDAPKRDALKAFAHATLKDMAGESAMKGENTAGYFEAKRVIDAVFTKLDELASKK